MHHAIHATDFIFQTKLGTYPLTTQCEILRELGYNGLKVSSWSDELKSLSTIPQAHGLDVSGVYAIYRRGLEGRISQLVESLEGCSSIELALHSGEQVQDVDLKLIEHLLPICEQRGINIALYPHIRYGMQTTTEAVQICERFNHAHLGIVFNGYHWYAAQENQLEQRLDAVWPWLMGVNIAGCRMSPLGWGGVATIEPLDEGDMDNFVLLGALRRRGYEGPIAFLGWEGMGGDVYNNLRRSRDAFRSMEMRYESHPHWTLMNTP